MTLPSRVTVPGLLTWVMVLLPPLLVLRRVGGARNPSVSSGWGEGLLLGPGGVRAVPVKVSDTLDTGCRTGSGGLQVLHPSIEKPTCSLVACGQQHAACGGLTTAILDLNGKCSLHTAPWLPSANGHGQWSTGLF